MADDEPEEDSEGAGPIAQAFGMTVLVLLVGLAVVLGVGLWPDELAEKSDPGFVDNIFDNQLVVLFARLLLVSATFVLAFGGIFIVVSTMVRMRNKEWLRRAGPFEVSEEAVDDLREQIQVWQDEARSGQDELQEPKGEITGIRRTNRATNQAA